MTPDFIHVIVWNLSQFPPPVARSLSGIKTESNSSLQVWFFVSCCNTMSSIILHLYVLISAVDYESNPTKLYLRILLIKSRSWFIQIVVFPLPPQSWRMKSIGTACNIPLWQVVRCILHSNWHMAFGCVICVSVMCVLKEQEPTYWGLRLISLVVAAIN